jgi:hypothetical protein
MLSFSGLGGQHRTDVTAYQPSWKPCQSTCRCTAITVAMRADHDAVVGTNAQSIVLGPVPPLLADRSPRPIVASSGCAGFKTVVAQIPDNPCEGCGGTGKTRCGACRQASFHSFSNQGKCLLQSIDMMFSVQYSRTSPRLFSHAPIVCWIRSTCRGKGRVNMRDAKMLPAGVWPVWCSSCRASGQWVCERCFGTGRHRERIGFRI